MVNVIARIRYRVGYVWWWRWKHWYFDSREAVLFRWCAGLFMMLCCLLSAFHLYTAPPPPPNAPHKAIFWIIFFIIIALLAAVALALTGSSKQAAPQDQNANAPKVQDGQSLPRHYGTVWVDDSAQAAWKVVGKDPITESGGGK